MATALGVKAIADIMRDETRRRQSMKLKSLRRVKYESKSKKTGEIVEVHTCDDADFQDRQGRFYWEHQLYFGTLDDFDKDVPDYWTRLEHQYAGMAMQAYIIASHISQFSFCEGDMKDCKSMAHVLVEELKKKEERK